MNLGIVLLPVKEGHKYLKPSREASHYYPTPHFFRVHPVFRAQGYHSGDRLPAPDRSKVNPAAYETFQYDSDLLGSAPQIPGGPEEECSTGDAWLWYKHQRFTGNSRYLPEGDPGQYLWDSYDKRLYQCNDCQVGGSHHVSEHYVECWSCGGVIYDGPRGVSTVIKYLDSPQGAGQSNYQVEVEESDDDL